MAKKEKEEEQGKLKGKKYMKELRRLQAELCKLQDWIKYKGLRVIVVFEGRDAAGQGRHHSRDHGAHESQGLPVRRLARPIRP